MTFEVTGALDIRPIKIFLFCSYNILILVSKTEGRRGKKQNPKPKTEIPIPTPEREMGKREKGQEKKGGEPSASLGLSSQNGGVLTTD